jgi:thiamine biosynthesis lipoprotein
MTVLPTTNFRAMGTEVEVLGYPELPLHVADQVQARFMEIEAALSRFRPDSELSRLNRSGGRPFKASELLQGVLIGALEAACRSGGLFDPTMLGALEAAGYSRSFDDLDASLRAANARPAPAGRYSAVEVRDDGHVVLHDGVRLDFGGYAKGWTVDSVEELMQGCLSWVVNAGGDLLARGTGPTGEGWLVGIQDPFDPNRDVGVLAIADGAVATTSRMRRRWTTDAGPAHHIIDPATGRPADTGLASVTVITSTSAQAEVLAKVLFLMGPRDGVRYAESGDATGAVFVLDDGSDIWTSGASQLRVS